jgi:sulfoquinovose isomerase
LAASSAKVAAHPGADRLPTDISTIIRERFWGVQYRAVAEEFTSEWQPFSRPKPDMRLTESLMAAFDAANDSTYRPLRKELPNLMISGMQHVLLVSIIYLHIVLLNKV